MSRASLALLVLSGLTGLAPALAQAQSRKLNGPLAPLPADQGALRIFESRLSPDSAWVVYRADHDLTGADGLFSVPADASEAARALWPASVESFVIDPTSSHVAFRTPSGVLLLAPLDGSSMPRQIRTTASHYAFTPDGSQLVFVDGGLYGTSVQGGDPLLLAPEGGVFVVSADGAHVVYRLRTEFPFFVFEDELWSVPLDGSAAPTLLTSGLVGEVNQFRSSPDGARLLFVFAYDKLYSVELQGPPTRQLLSQHVVSYELSADGRDLVYVETSASSRRTLFRRQLPGGPAQALVGPLQPDEGIGPVAFTDDGRIVFGQSTGDGSVNVMPLQGGPIQTLDRGADLTSFQLTPDTNWIVFTAVDAPGEPEHLYSARLATTPHAQRAPRPSRTLVSQRLDSPTFDEAEIVRFAPSRDSRSVVFVGRQDSWTEKLFVVDVAGKEPPLELSAPFPEGGGLRDLGFVSGTFYPSFEVAAGHVVYRADQETDERIELFSVPLDRAHPPVRLNPVLAPSPEAGYLSSFRVDPDGEHVLFVGHGGRFGVDELYRVPLAGGAATRLNPPLRPDTDVQPDLLVLSPDGSRLVFQIEPPVQEAGPFYDLHVVDLDTPGPSRILTDELQGNSSAFDLEVSPDSQSLVFRPFNSVYGARLDGSVPPVQVGTAYPVSFHDRSLRVTLDSQRVLFVQGHPLTFAPVLYSAPLDGSAPPVLLSGAQLLRLDAPGLAEFEPASGGRVAFLGREPVGPLAIELYSAPADGSQAPARLSGPLVSGGNVLEFAVAGPRVVYRADEVVDERVELYSAPLDASQPRTQLSGAFAAGNAGVFDFLVTPGGAEVLYDAQQSGHSSRGIYRVPSDGSAPAVRLGPARVVAWTLSPDGATVVYISNHRVTGIYEVFSVPLDGSRAPVRLSGNMSTGGDVRWDVGQPLQITPDSRTVVYLADQLVNDRFELFAVDIDGLTPSVVLNGPLAPDGDVQEFGPRIPAFQLTPAGDEVVYLAQEASTRFELYAAPLP